MLNKNVAWSSTFVELWVSMAILGFPCLKNRWISYCRGTFSINIPFSEKDYKERRNHCDFDDESNGNLDNMNGFGLAYFGGRSFCAR